VPIKPQLNPGCTILIFHRQKPVKLFIEFLLGRVVTNYDAIVTYYFL
jgi:hypothetical protein